MRIDLRLTHPAWQFRETPHGLLRWRGFPDSVAALEAAFAEALAIPNASAPNRGSPGNSTPNDATRDGAGPGGAIPNSTVFGAVAGHWCALLETPTGVLASQDRLRSWPLFIAARADGDNNGDLTVTDDIAVARDTAGSPARDGEAALEFLNLGYVTGGDTLFEGVTQLQAGEWRWWGGRRAPSGAAEDGDRAIGGGILPILRHADPGVEGETALDRAFDTALDTVFDRVLDRIGDRQVVIPLSGGLDSRLLAIAMRDRGHERVLNFTYGTGRTREVGISEEVAHSLDQPWEFVQYTPEEIREAWASPEAGSFIRESYAGASLPHIQDWYAVAQLQQRGLLDDDAVFLPGHTVVGNTHDEAELADPAPMSRAQLTRVIVGHHATIRPDRDALLASPRFLAKLDAFYDRMRYAGTPLDRLDAMEGWNIQERQTKYINHSVRAYEHFGYEWALPMLDRELFEAWETFGLAVAQDREWYRRYVNRRYAAATGHDIATFEGFAAANVSRSNRDRVRAVLSLLGLLGRVERGIKARAVANHPMGFQSFTGDTTPQELHRFIMRGGDPMGIYTERFLDDSWNPHARVFGD
ncbi:MAG: asparagine synthase-related protein [Leucobacter sp.]